jgi:hypothetical protein
MNDSKREFEVMPAEQRAVMLSNETSVFLNVAKFEQVSRVATMLSKTDFIPAQFKGHVGNCMIALDLADRMKMHPIMLMQAMYVVHGRPGFEGKFASALVNNSGRYTDPLAYEWRGKQGDENWGCRAYATRKSTDKVVYGPWVDWAMVQAEGWSKKPGSKWLTMPEIMFNYRAASFFAKVNDSDLMMGMATLEELEDVTGELIQQPDGTYSTGSGEKTDSLYEVNRQVKEDTDAGNGQAKPDEAQPESKPAESQEPADPGKKETAPEASEDSGAQESNDQGAQTDQAADHWDPETWKTLKTPGVKQHAERYGDTFKDQPASIRDKFRMKWDRCEGLQELKFPFDVVGNWVGYEKSGVLKDPDKMTYADLPIDLVDEMNEAWINGDPASKRTASELVGNGSARPKPYQVKTWLTYYNTAVQKQQQPQAPAPEDFDGPF